jgi:hypothetical protein
MREMTGVPEGTLSSPCRLLKSALAASAVKTGAMEEKRILGLALTRINIQGGMVNA